MMEWRSEFCWVRLQGSTWPKGFTLPVFVPSGSSSSSCSSLGGSPLRAEKHLHLSKKATPTYLVVCFHILFWFVKVPFGERREAAGSRIFCSFSKTLRHKDTAMIYISVNIFIYILQNSIYKYIFLIKLSVVSAHCFALAVS